MNTVSHFLPDVNDELAWREEREDLWEQEPAYVPTQFARLVEAGMDPEGAADVVDFLADDGLPVCADPPDIADDGLLVVVWPRMKRPPAAWVFCKLNRVNTIAVLVNTSR
jgi:hypothetical protein